MISWLATNYSTQLIKKYRASLRFWIDPVRIVGLLSSPGIKLVGFFSCEDNESDIQTPTISMAIFLYDITDATKSQLLNLFAVNGDMHGCWFLAECIDDRWRLVLNRRIMVESYQPGELRDNIMLMLGRFSIFQDRIEQTLSAI